MYPVHPRATRRYAVTGDRKPGSFKVGDLFVYPNGETAMVMEVYDEYNGESEWGPQWTLRLLWTPGKDGSTENHQKDGNDAHGVLRTNMFNKLSIGRGPHLYPVKE